MSRITYRTCILTCRTNLPLFIGIEGVRDFVDSKFADVQDALAKINSDLQRPLNRLTFQLNQMKDDLSKQQRLGVLLWLSKVAYRKHHVAMSANLLPGSCAWLERNLRIGFVLCAGG
jgi:hypothetical protein